MNKNATITILPFSTLDLQSFINRLQKKMEVLSSAVSIFYFLFMFTEFSVKCGPILKIHFGLKGYWNYTLKVIQLSQSWNLMRESHGNRGKSSNCIGMYIVFVKVSQMKFTRIYGTGVWIWESTTSCCWT